MESIINKKKINRDKLSRLKTASEHFDERYGEKNSPNRIEFEYSTTLYLIGELFKESRIKLKLTQEDLAEKTGLKRSYISKIEKGETDIRLSNFIKLLMGLDLNIFNLKELEKHIQEEVLV